MAYIQVPNSFGQGGGVVKVTSDGKIELSPDSGENVEITSGQLLLPDGSAGVPALAFAADKDVGLLYDDGLLFTSAGLRVAKLSSAGLFLQQNARLAWTNTVNDPTATPDLQLHRDAPDTLAQRRSDNNNTFRLYNEFTNASNYARLAFVTADGAYTISPQAAGTGTLRGLTVGETGTSLGFFGATPVAQPSAYSPSNVTTDRTYDANSTSTAELADVLGTLISDLQGLGLIG